MKLLATVTALAAPALAKQQWTRGSEQVTGEFVELANGLPGCGPAAQTSGYFKITGSGKTDLNYFFWFAESVNSPETAPVSMWLTGGPGCSSMLALLSENGPCRASKHGQTCSAVSEQQCGVDSEGEGKCSARGCCWQRGRCHAPANVEVETNEHSWNTNSNMLWVDQPANVGFSYGAAGDADKNEDGVADDMYFFLKELHEYFKNKNAPYADAPFFVVGESYGGHYAPSVAQRLYRGLKSGDSNMNLKGLAVGNGLTNPAIQYQYYPQMAYNNSYGIKTVSEAQYNQMQSTVQSCVKLINGCQNFTGECRLAQTICNVDLVSPFQQSGLNTYDIRIPCEVPGLCYDFGLETALLNEPAIMQQLGVNTAKVNGWQSCNYQVNAAFGADWMKDQSGKVLEVLEGGVRVLIYAGDADWICNWYGNKAWTLDLEWSGRAGFNFAGDKAWMVNGEHGGDVRTYNGFTFLRVFGAGHMVPMNQPSRSMEMIDNFRNNVPL